jgi:hypothetical protein
MPFHYILANLLAKNDAVGVLFVDGSGEAVDLACADFTPYQMKVVGAYMGICLHQMQRLLGSGDWGSPQIIHVEREELHFYGVTLPEDYYLVLVQHRPGLVARSRASLLDAAEQLRRTLFDPNWRE